MKLQPRKATPNRMRLQKMMALSTDLSRRAAEKAISRGEVTVNGTVIKVMGTTVDAGSDRVRFRGQYLRLPERFFYIAFYKPRRTLVTKNDPEGRPTIWENLKEWKARLNAVGRLDYDSEGLLFLTNDGEMLNLLTHPRHEIKKVYEVKVKGEPKEETLEKLRGGVVIEGVKTLAADVKILKSADKNTWLEIGIREGRNRQIRKMCEAVGHNALRLRRMSIGTVKLGKMKPGEWRFLGQKEAMLLREALRLAGRSS